MNRLVIAHGNIYAGNKSPARAISTLLATGACSIGFNEAYGQIEALATKPGYRLHYGPGARDQRRGAKDTPILTRKSLPSVGSFAFQASDEVKPVKIAPDRWITGSMFKHPFGVITHINIHPNAAVAGQSKRIARVQQYDLFMRTLHRVLMLVENESDAIVVTGDLNLPEGKKTGARTPYQVFEAYGLTWQTQHLDAIAWTEDSLVLADWRSIPETATGSDHPFLVASFAQVGKQ